MKAFTTIEGFDVRVVPVEQLPAALRQNYGELRERVFGDVLAELERVVVFAGAQSDAYALRDGTVFLAPTPRRQVAIDLAADDVRLQCSGLVAGMLVTARVLHRLVPVMPPDLELLLIRRLGALRVACIPKLDQARFDAIITGEVPVRRKAERTRVGEFA